MLKYCSVAKSVREYSDIYLRPRSLWNGFIPPRWFSNCCFLNSRKTSVSWRSTSWERNSLSVPSFYEFRRIMYCFHKTATWYFFCESHESTHHLQPCLRLRILRHNVTCQRSPKWYFVGLCWRFCELSPTSRLCGLLMGSLNSQSVQSFPKLESRTPLRSLCYPRGIVIESCTDAVFPRVKWTPTRGRSEKQRALRCLLTCRTVKRSQPSQIANWWRRLARSASRRRPVC